MLQQKARETVLEKEVFFAPTEVSQFNFNSLCLPPKYHNSISCNASQVNGVDDRGGGRAGIVRGHKAPTGQGIKFC